MGYDLHITRADDWFDSELSPITREEWFAVVRDDPELEIDPRNGPAVYVIWSGPSEHDEPWVAWSEGRVHSKNPDVALRRKMAELALILDARLVGDDGDEYGLDGEEIDRSPGRASESIGLRIRIEIWMQRLRYWIRYRR